MNLIAFSGPGKCVNTQYAALSGAMGCIKAFVETFPDGASECCFFHLGQAHWRKIMDMGVRTRYIEDETLALNLKMFTALAFVPPDDIVSVFNELKENTPEVDI